MADERPARGPESPTSEPKRLMHRASLRMLRSRAGRTGDEPLQREDWEVLWRMHESGASRVINRLLRRLPSSPRCGVCGAPFAGPGRRVSAVLGFEPSRKNPTVCSMCVELSPPGGTPMRVGIMFADLRGFTARFEGGDPTEATAMLRRFYRAAEDVLFPQAVIDKVIGDEVMALYLPELTRRFSHAEMPELMLSHAQALLRELGYGSGSDPFAELGVGLDLGEAFVGNIGQRALYDFTAVGDPVNTASRLQGQASGGEIVYSDRVAAGLQAPVGTRVELQLKGKRNLQVAYRARVG